MPDNMTPAPTDLHWLTIAEAARLIERRRLSPVELTDALLARIEELDPQLNAFLLPTFEKAREQARAAEREIMAGDYRGALHGMPFGLKDIYCTAGIRTTSHSRICADYVPTEDATTVTRLLRGRRGAARQARDPRIRAWRAVVRSAVAAGAQPVEPRAFHRRLVERRRRGGRGGLCAGGDGLATPAGRSAARRRYAASSG